MFKHGFTANQVQVADGSRHFRMEKTASGLALASDMINNNSRAVDIGWLPLAAEQYCVSANINDYIICDVPIVHVDVPNRNLDEFPFEEVSRFDTDTGRPVYQSFIGKPTHQDHDNKDPQKAKGIIFDATLEKDASGLYVIRILAAYDRTKDRPLTDKIMSGERPGHSMGALVGYTMCSYPNCGATSSTGKIHCAHMEGSLGKGNNLKGQLLYERCYNVRYIENSSVGDQADWYAQQAWAK